MNYCETIHRSNLLLTTTDGGVCSITGRYTYVDGDLFQVEITSPFTGLRDGEFRNYPMERKTFYIKDGRITRLCRSEAIATLRNLYENCVRLERNREAFRKIVLGALREGIAFDQLHFNFPRPDESDEVLLTLMEDNRSLRQQRDEFVLTRILLQLMSQHGRDIVKCCGREFQSAPSVIRFQGGIRIPTLSRSFVVGPPLRSFFLLSRVVASLSRKRSHVRRLPEVHRRRTVALASPTRSVCAP